MKKSQERMAFLGNPQPPSLNVNASSSTLTLSKTPAFSASPRSPYVSVGNIPVQSRRNETMDFGNSSLTDSAKKNRSQNRRRERKHKFQLNNSNSVSSESTPYTSPRMLKQKLVTTSQVCQYDQLASLLPLKKEDTPACKEDESPLKFTCNIISMDKTRNGKVFRKRNKEYKYINLKSFLGSAKTYIFETHLQKLSSALKDLTLAAETRTYKGRKYFNNTALRQKTKVETKTQREKWGRTTEKGQHGNEANQSVFVSEDSSVEVNQNTSRSSGKLKTPKKEKHKRHKHERKAAKEAQESFPASFTADMAKLGYQNGELIKGFIRINPKNSQESYVSNPNSSLPDYFLTSIADRNRALEGDQVLLLLKPEEEWQEGKQTAIVVFILDKIHPRTTVGNLKPSGELGYALFYPRDKRMPCMRIPEVSCPNGFRRDPKAYSNILYLGRLLQWSQPHKAVGVIIDTLGRAGDLNVETLSILKEFCLDITPYTPDMVQFFPKTKVIPQEELKKREDIRKECVFTIDPLTARDLDDAVSVKELPNGNYEIGVHISDASYYLAEDTPLDQIVSQKATTIYLVDTVYHMLPVELCLHCSLLPGEDKLAFSVFWEMNLQGEIFNTRFVRTVLNSCAQLAYEHAQQMIENPSKEFKKEELPQIHNKFTVRDLSKTVNVLQKIAVNLREARIKSGSLRIDQIKLLFNLNPRNGEPTDFIVYENKESHRLIEEFMLLANISVARKINESFPDIAFLRCHEPPKYTMLVEAQRTLESFDYYVDVSSSGGIHSSLKKYITNDYQGMCRQIVLNHIFAKPMARARYFCAGSMDNEEKYNHYALSVPIYTHFTSPIRRYADIMVHRLLAASLGYAPKPKWDLDHVNQIAANCNCQKYNAKRAGEASSNLYLAHYIEKNQPYIQDCIVIDVKDRSFDAIALKTGSVVRIYAKKCEDNPTWTIENIAPSSSNVTKSTLEHEKKILRLIIEFPETENIAQTFKLTVEMFTIVKVALKRVSNSYKLEATLLRPMCTKIFQKSKSNHGDVGALNDQSSN
ncbi:DIS3-like exonuclease 2 [Euwallacea similis]|uniref:DIS3-like exonuclease 2 n=1 Tax=Euwallacea similis TaxID=1736056 RepID=UPI0034507DE6